MKKGVFVWMLFLSLTWFFPMNLAFGNSFYNVGALFSVTGREAPMGTVERNTVKMLEEDINKAGGIKGHPLKVFYYDDASEKERAVLAVKKLIQVDKVSAIVGPSMSSCAMAIIPIVDKEEVPLIACCAAVQIVEPVKKHAFKVVGSSNFQIQRMIVDFFKPYRIAKIAVLYVDNAYGKSGLDGIMQECPKAGISIIMEETFGGRDTNMITQLTKIKGSDAQAVIVWGTNPGPAIIAKNANEIGLKIPLINSGGCLNEKFLELSGHAAEGVYIVGYRMALPEQLPSTDPLKPQILKYITDYKQRYGEATNLFGGNAWEAFMLVVNAMKNVGTDRAKIREYIENAKNFQGMSGTYNFSPSDHNGIGLDAYPYITVVKGGKFTLLSK
jgi:branched-chain amino acid transport system substrate-binding protein